MLQFRIKSVIESRGIPNVYTWLRKQCKISQRRCAAIASNRALRRIDLTEILALCIELDCTPNELLDFDSSKLHLPPTHSLHQLTKPKLDTQLNKLIAQSNRQTKEQILELLRKENNIR